MKSFKKSAVALAVGAGLFAVGSVSASASVLPGPISNWTLNLPSGQTVGINTLDFAGNSLVTNTPTSTTGIFNSTDIGVYAFTGFNESNVPALNLGGGQLTAVVNSTDIANINTGNFVYTGGSISFYYNSSAVFGTTSSNCAGACSGNLLATFNIMQTNDPTTSGGNINANLTPTSNGTITVTGLAPTTVYGNNGQPLTSANAPFLDSSGNPLLYNLMVGFVTANASVNTTFNTVPSTGSVPYYYQDVYLSGASGFSGPVANNINGGYFFVKNGGQFSLEYVPEPATMALFGAGLVAVALAMRQRKTFA